MHCSRCCKMTGHPLNYPCRRPSTGQWEEFSWQPAGTVAREEARNGGEKPCLVVGDLAHEGALRGVGAPGAAQHQDQALGAALL